MPKKLPSIFNFVLIAAVVFILTFILLYAVGAVPDEFNFFTETPGTATTSPSTSSTKAASTPSELPQQISIPSIGVNSVILNPQTTDVVALDQLLLKGAVRYPTSAPLGRGTVFIFGHNTGLPAINPAYKTFNGLRTVQNGASIEIDSATTRYFYTVTSVALVNSDTAYVDISSTDNELVISTCNVFGAKEQRYIVHAHFSTSRPI